MHCDNCGKDDFTHISQLNKHKPICPEKPPEIPYFPSRPPYALSYDLSNAQVNVLEARFGENYAVALNKHVDALIKEMTSGSKANAVIPREFMLRHLPMVIPILPRKCILAWDIHGELDDDLNLHVESIRDHRRGR